MIKYGCPECGSEDATQITKTETAIPGKFIRSHKIASWAIFQSSIPVSHKVFLVEIAYRCEKCFLRFTEPKKYEEEGLDLEIIKCKEE